MTAHIFARPIKRHPLAGYFALTFAISWGIVLGVLALGGEGLVPSEQKAEELLPLVVLGMIAGPSIAGLVCCAVIDGRSGLHELRQRLFRWRVNWGWYVLAFLGLPAMAAAVLVVLQPLSDDFTPGIVDAGNRWALVAGGVVAGLSAGIFEEVGWTGFATPRLRRRHGLLAGGLILGFLWGAWHYVTALVGSGTETGGVSLSLFLAMMLFYVAVLPPVRVLMAWVHDRTQSLLILVVMHCSLTGNVLFILMPEDPSPATLAAWYAGIALLAWAAVLLLAFRPRPEPLAQPLPAAGRHVRTAARQ